jgi:conserved domain protein
MASEMKYGICPQCGYINFYVNPSKFPICESCGYEDPIIMTTEEMREFESSLNLPETESKNDKVKPVVSTADLQSHEALREKYVYPSEHFSKKAYNDMLEYDRKERKRLQEFWDTAGRSEQSKPKCPTCGSTDLRKVSVGAKTVSVGLFGIFSQKVKKTWHCNSCGYEW